MAALRGSAEAGDTCSAILDIAERLVQSRGFNGFSYADVAGELGITKAALHYHFPGKAELGKELVIRYAARFLASLAAIGNADTSAAEKLRAYADLYLGVASRGRYVPLRDAGGGLRDPVGPHAPLGAQLFR